jgi:2-phosphosulfolactate phosphatase
MEHRNSAEVGRDIQMTKIDVVLLPEEVKDRDISDFLVVLIDVLRASSTITTALAEGAKKIIPVFSPEEARQRAEDYHPGLVLLGGERNGEKLPGFDLGNSPLEYRSQKIKNKIILLSTTNGVKAINQVTKAKKIIIGCFLNIQAVIQYCQSYSKGVLLVCAGNRGSVSLEDTVCAGMIKYIAEGNNKQADPDYTYYYDDAFIAGHMYLKFKDDLLNMFKASNWGQHLRAMGLEEDLIFCAQENIYHKIPVMKNDSIVIDD